MPTKRTMIELRGVRKVYGEAATGVRALAGIDLYIGPGEFVSVMGPSGSGKSTLLNLISALDTPTEGDIYLDGQSTAEMDDEALTRFRRTRIGLIFQFFNLLPTLDVFNNVLLPVLLERKETRQDEQRVRALLGEVGLEKRLRHQVHQLSGGEMQRVAIARALMMQPRLLLADEPTGNLDSTTGAAILQLLRDTCERHGTTIVMVTHDAAAARIGHRLVSLKDGRVVSDEALRDRPAPAMRLA
jgi:putative ABC transport system ATP-binding protein